MSKFREMHARWVIASVLVGVIAIPRSALAEEPSAVSVEVTAKVDDPALVQKWIVDAATPVVARHEIADKDTIEIRIGGEYLDYQVAIDLIRGGIVDVEKPFACKCTDDELIAKVEETLEARLSKPPSAEEPVTPGEPDPDPDPQPPANETDGKPGPLRGMGKAGIALLSISVPAIAGGIAMVVIGERFTGNDAESQDLRPGGFALLAGGAALAITGAVLLGVDRKRAKKKSVAMFPYGGSQQFGVAVRGRF